MYASAVDAPDGTYTEVEGGTSSCRAGDVLAPTAIETLNMPNTTPNSNNACSCGAPAGASFGGLVPCTAQFQQLTPAIPGLGPFSFVAYRSITVPGFDVFGRVAGASICQIPGLQQAPLLRRYGRQVVSA